MSDDSGKRTSESNGAAEAALESAGAAEGPSVLTAPAGAEQQDVFAGLQMIAQQAFMQPMVFVQHYMKFWQEMFGIWTGQSELEPDQKDKRFRDPAWEENPFYRAYLQTYLAWRNGLRDIVNDSALEGDNKRRAKFAVTMLTDAAAPTNTLLGNPAAIKRFFETGGASLARGFENMVGDIVHNGGMPSQVDKEAFEVGENIALTPGAVVFKNEVLELIQYAPQTEQVHSRPLFLVPPQINKYYVFDMAPDKSFVEYAVKNGIQFFMVSWRNPTREHRDWGFETYVQALLEAIDATIDITGSEDVNVMGACSGGMTTAMLLGYLAAKGDPRINAATLIVTLLDSSVESELGMFASKSTVQLAKQVSKLKGVMEGQEMARVFAWMRPNDLVWNYWVNNYLLGNDPPAFDLLYWNNDTTQVPARTHHELLDLFVGNSFRKPGALKVLGTPVDLSKVDYDAYVIAGRTDHITPWKGNYAITQMLGGETEFILNSGGHIQTVVNPPDNPKAKFYINPQLPADPDEWLDGAKENTGSWWEHWRDWILARSGDKKDAPASLGNDRYTPGTKAPGTYVLG